MTSKSSSKSSSSSSSSSHEQEQKQSSKSLKRSSSSRSSSSSSSLVENAMPTKPVDITIKPIVYFFAFIGALSGLTFGYDIGGSGGTFIMPSFRQFWKWDNECYYLKSFRSDFTTTEEEVIQYDNVQWPAGFDWEMDRVAGMSCPVYYTNVIERNSDGQMLDTDGNVVEDPSTFTGEYRKYDIKEDGTGADGQYVKYTADLQEIPCMSCCCNYNPDLNTGADSPEGAESGDITLMETIGCAVGSLFAGLIADLIGRRMALFSSAVLFIAGAVTQILTPGSDDARYATMIAGRVVGGLGIGLLSMQATLYQAEIAPEKIRGFLVTLQQLMITTGIVSASLINLGLQTSVNGWRYSYGGNAFIAAIMAILCWIAPESPYWLMCKKGRKEDAIKNLRKIRTSEEEVVYEIWAMEEEMKRQALIADVSIGELFSNKFNNSFRMFTVCFYHILQQFTGINAIMFFGPSIVTMIFGAGIGKYGGLIFNTVNFLATFICVFAVDRFGRMPLILSGTVLCLLGQLMAAICACPIQVESTIAIDPTTGQPTTIDTWLYERSDGVGWCIIVGVCLFVVGFAYSWGPLAWVYGAEALNFRTKAYGMSIGIACNWGTAALVSKLFPIMNQRDAMGIHGCFFFFSAWLLISLVFLLFCIPETSGVPLDKMDELFATMKIEFAGKKLKKWQSATETQ